MTQVLKEDIDDSQREDIFKDLIDELINIIVGLSIKDFPPKYQNLILSTPSKQLEKELLAIKTLKSKNFEIKSSSVFLNCYIIKK